MKISHDFLFSGKLQWEIDDFLVVPPPRRTRTLVNIRTIRLQLPRHTKYSSYMTPHTTPRIT